ncbi:DUF3429 domain-containing protein [Albirhodobacter sp. R86504]|uniref:DUF3429 domain-containing protein n=1 Tax=Albirhodobacter sp. R86504 TaxID=3093848 RepID=UPI00366FF1E1
MIRTIPKTALWLGLGGLIPFLATTLALRFGVALPLALPAEKVLLGYGIMIFAFMSGALWGFAAKSNWAFGYVLSVAPVVIGFLAVISGGVRPIDALIIGFITLLPLDFAFARCHAAPAWWMSLRLVLTTVVVACLIAVWRAGI